LESGLSILLLSVEEKSKILDRNATIAQRNIIPIICPSRIEISLIGRCKLLEIALSQKVTTGDPKAKDPGC
jgi:hypothetical protein